ncbi:MAG: hypothetical protein OQK51_23270 [Kangiellaceae bacterium]|nr:hypothetical protein [Kangiellaceae bacterium]
MKNSINKLATILLLSCFCISCSSVEQETTEPESKHKVVAEEDKKSKQSDSDIQVTTSQGKQSKPLSDSSGNAEQQKNEETYVVPNKEFPLKDVKQKDKNKKEEKDKEPPKR